MQSIHVLNERGEEHHLDHRLNGGLLRVLPAQLRHLLEQQRYEIVGGRLRDDVGGARGDGRCLTWRFHRWTWYDRLPHVIPFGHEWRLDKMNKVVTKKK